MARPFRGEVLFKIHFWETISTSLRAMSRCQRAELFLITSGHLSSEQHKQIENEGN